MASAINGFCGPIQFQVATAMTSPSEFRITVAKPHSSSLVTLASELIFTIPDSGRVHRLIAPSRLDRVTFTCALGSTLVLHTLHLLVINQFLHRFLQNSLHRSLLITVKCYLLLMLTNLREILKEVRVVANNLMIVYMWKLLEALTRRDSFGLGSQAAAIKESLKFPPSISTDVVRPDKVAAMKAKIKALTLELQQKNLEEETSKQNSSKHWERIFGRFVTNINQNSSVQLEREGDNENDQMDANENDSMSDEV